MITSGIYFGTITAVYEPKLGVNETDSSEYQYIYEVVVATEQYAYLPVRCTRMDPVGGGQFNYDDIIFTVGQGVFVGFPFNDTSRGVIIGGRREHADAQAIDGAIRWMRRFNEINQSISNNGIWKLQHISATYTNGPSMILNQDQILFNDGGPTGQPGDDLAQSIEIDARNNTITVNSGEWTLNSRQGVTINVTAGDVNVNCINSSLTARQAVNVKAETGDVNVEGLNANVTAQIRAKVDAKQILLNSNGNPLEGVMTTLTQPTCYVTGIPFRGSTTVKAGS